MKYGKTRNVMKSFAWKFSGDQTALETLGTNGRSVHCENQWIKLVQHMDQW